jgi:RNA 3'-terminal phosphate cyclase (ATP)
MATEAYVQLDGSMGEGGGQILRSALSLSVITRRPFRITNIRANRRRPGLRPQHVTAVRAAAAISAARVSEAEVGTQALTFEPSGLEGGTYAFAVGTAGSATLVAQTVLFPLLTAADPSTVTVEGGTHNPQAPPFEFLKHAVLPLINRMGPQVTARLERPGFYPAGGGRLHLRIEPSESLQPLRLTERGPERGRRTIALVANLPRHIGEREVLTLHEHLPGGVPDRTIRTPNAHSPGNALALLLAFEHVTAVVTGLGEKGKPAEEVAREVAEAGETFLRSGVPVGPYLADQLLIPLAMAGGTFITGTPTGHTRTNALVIASFHRRRLSLDRRADAYRITAEA